MRITALLLLIAVSLSIRGQAVSEAKTECEVLLNEAMPFAQKMLREHGEFYPYGYEMNPTGDIKLVAGYTGTDHPKSQTIIDLLVEGFKQDAAAKKVKATALVYDMMVVPPGAIVKTDAIAVALDHRDNYSVIVIFPRMSWITGISRLGHLLRKKENPMVFPLASAN